MHLKKLTKLCRKNVRIVLSQKWSMVVIKEVMVYLRYYPNDLLKNQTKLVKALVDRSTTSHWEKHQIPDFPVNTLGPKGTSYDGGILWYHSIKCLKSTLNSDTTESFQVLPYSSVTALLPVWWNTPSAVCTAPQCNAEITKNTLSWNMAKARLFTLCYSTILVEMAWSGSD